MSRTLTDQDRASLIRLASSLPAGSADRKAILAGLHLQGADKGLVACPNCMGSGSVKTYEKGDRALHDLKPCPDCKGKKEVSADRAKAIRRNIDKSASSVRSSRTAAKRGDIVFLPKSILDFFQEKVVPKGQYVVGKTMKGEVSLRPYPLSAHPGYLVDAAVLAAAMTLAGPSKSASFSPNATEALSAPADAGTMRGAKKWVVLLRMVILGDTATSSPERAALIREAKRRMSYATFLFRRNRGLVAYYEDQAKQLESLQDIVPD